MGDSICIWSTHVLFVHLFSSISKHLLAGSNDMLKETIEAAKKALEPIFKPLVHVAGAVFFVKKNFLCGGAQLILKCVCHEKNPCIPMRICRCKFQWLYAERVDQDGIECSD